MEVYFGGALKKVPFREFSLNSPPTEVPQGTSGTSPMLEDPIHSFPALLAPENQIFEEKGIFKVPGRIFPPRDANLGLLVPREQSEVINFENPEIIDLTGSGEPNSPLGIEFHNYSEPGGALIPANNGQGGQKHRK